MAGLAKDYKVFTRGRDTFSSVVKNGCIDDFAIMLVSKA